MTLDEAKKVLDDCPPDMHCCDACFLDERCQAETLLMMHVEDLERQNEELQKDAICALVRVPRWISVEERLPEANVFAIVYVTNQAGWWDIELDCVDEDGNWTINADSDWHTVTHWMPLPEPPMEGKE